MNALEKVLKEMDKKRESLIDKSDDEPELCDVEDWYDEGVDSGKIKAYCDAADIVRSHMDEITKDDWIPVSERLPEPDKMVVVTVHCSEWISDYDSVWVSEDEKIHHSEEYLVSMGYVVNDLGDWAFFDLDGYEIPCDKEFGTDKGDFYSVVTAWRSFKELKPYKGGTR